MKNRFLSIFAAIAVTLSLSACQNGNTEQTAPLTTQSSEETTSTEIQYVTDWSIDELVKNIELNGKTYSMPFTLDDLGEEYSIGEKIEITETSASYPLYYNGTEIALINVNNQKYICSISISNKYVDFKAGNFYIGNSREEINKEYGKPTMFVENIDSYSFDDTKNICVFYNSKNVVDGIAILYEE